MANFTVGAIQQVGVGTVDFHKSWDWFIEMFGIDIRILEDDTVAERMLPYTGGKPQKRHACIAVSLQGGGGLEIWKFSERTPQPVPFEISVGDLGIFAAKIKCRDVEAFHREISAKWKDCSAVGTLPDGTPCFYVKDLYGNWFQLVERKDIFIEQRRLTGGVAGAVIGVTDMDASVRFYREILGYDVVLSDTTGPYWEDGFLRGGEQRYRRVILGDAAPRKGGFLGLLGTSTIELVQALERTPRKIYEGRYWGDPGFLQVCFDIINLPELKKFCAEKGFPFTVDSCPNGEIFDMGEASGHFAYIEDPDGTLIELVETFKVPVAKKLGIVIDMKKRDPEKVLPKVLFRLMGIFMREKIKG